MPSKELKHLPSDESITETELWDELAQICENQDSYSPQLVNALSRFIISKFDVEPDLDEPDEED